MNAFGLDFDAGPWIDIRGTFILTNNEIDDNPFTMVNVSGLDLNIESWIYTGPDV